jgi:Putative auto-transporter adhesin, head GIN domain
MKYTLIFCLSLVSITVFSQRTIIKSVGDFNELKVFDLIEVNLIQSTENKIVIKGSFIDDVKIINKNGKLKLRMNTDTRFQGEHTFINLYFTSITTIDANEGSSIVCKEVIVRDEIELKTQEGGMIKVGLHVNRNVVKAVSGGIVEVFGESNNQEVKLNSGGLFKGRELATKTTKVVITAAGVADINASEKVEVRITAGGDVNVYGNPKLIDKKRFAGGRIKIMN